MGGRLVPLKLHEIQPRTGWTGDRPIEDEDNLGWGTCEPFRLEELINRVISVEVYNHPPPPKELLEIPIEEDSQATGSDLLHLISKDEI